MIPSGRAVALLAFAGLLSIFAFALPALGWVALGFDALILGLVLIDGRRAGRTALEISRAHPAVLHQAEPAVLELILTAGPAPVLAWVREVLAPQLVRAPIDARLQIPAGGTGRLRLDVVPRSRGPALLAPAALRILGPWGLAWTPREGAVGDRLAVYPRVHLEPEANLLLRQATSRRTGARPLAAPGFSTELYALRAYRAGDPPGQLHWKSSARQNRPITRENAWEQHQHTLLLVDCGRPMAGLALAGGGEMSKLDYTLSAVLALLRVVVAWNDSATVVLFDREIRQLVRVDHRTRGFAPIFARVHAEAASLDEPDYHGVAEWCARRVPRSSLAIVLTSVIDLAVADRLGDALRGLARRHRPLLVDLQDPGLHQLANGVPEDLVGAYAKGSAMRLVEANASLAVHLRAAGIDTLGLPADKLAFGVLQRFLELKARRRS